MIGALAAILVITIIAYGIVVSVLDFRDEKSVPREAERYLKQEADE